MWKAKSTLFNTLFNSIAVVNNSAVLRVDEEKIYCRSLSTCGCVYGTFELHTDISGNGVHSFAIDRLAAITDSSDTLLDYKDSTLTVKRGKSRFKVVELSPNVVSEPRVLNVDLPYIVSDIETKDIQEAIRSINSYYNKDNYVPSVQFVLDKGTLTLQDQDKNAFIDIDCNISDTNIETDVIVGMDMLVSVINTLKPIISNPTLYIGGPEKPIKLQGSIDSFNILYYIAPRVTA